MNNLRILLDDGHEIFREGLKMLVSAQPDMEVIGEAKNGRLLSPSNCNRILLCN